jgi:WD40 repeat protein
MPETGNTANGNSKSKKSFTFPIIISALLGLLVYTNPSLEKYGDFVQQQVVRHSKTPQERIGASLFTAPLIASGVMLVTERTNYFLFSLYETNLEEIGRLRALGILNHFIFLEAPQSLPSKKSSASIPSKIPSPQVPDSTSSSLSSGKVHEPTELEKSHAPKPDSLITGEESSDIIHIDSFLGISSDFKVYAASDPKGVKIVDLEVGQQLPAPIWDRDWGSPRSAAFGKDIVAIVTGGDMFSRSVKVFSRETGELEQNIRGQINGAAFTADGRFLAFTEFRPSDGYYLVLRDIQEKKTVAEWRLGGSGYCSLAVARTHVVAYESDDDQITVIDVKTRRVVETLKSESVRKRKEFARGQMPLAISPTGNLIASAAEDAVVLDDINGRKNIYKLEGHLDIVRAIAFSPNEEIIATSAKDKTVRFWNVKERKEVHSIKNLPTSASELIISPEDKRIAIVYGEDGRGARSAEIRNVELR